LQNSGATNAPRERRVLSAADRPGGIEGARRTEGDETLRRKVSAADWRFPRRMTFAQWRRLPYRYRHAYLAQAQCTLLGHWRDCAHRRCRRAHRCLVPQPCYWDRKRAMTAADWARAEAACQPLRALLSIGSLKGSEGLWLF
jgi:hypothetical protein